MIHQTNLQFKNEIPLRNSNATKYIILHHSEVISRHTVNDVHQWHLNKGWAGIGYHYFIDKEGEIYEGRPMMSVGAHVYGHNQDSIGVCFEGNFNKEQMNVKQAEKALILIALLSLSYDNAKVVRHVDLAKEKNCPGNYFPYEKLCQKIETYKNLIKSLSSTELNQQILYDKLKNNLLINNR